MLNVRHIFRLCKQSTQRSLGPPSTFFSSNTDDSDSKSPPNNNREPSKNITPKQKQLDSLLDSTYLGKSSSTKPSSESSKVSPATSIPKKATKSDSSSKKKVKGDDSIQKLLDALNIRSEGRGDAKLQEKGLSVSGTPVSQSVDLAIKKQKNTVSSNDLLVKLKKIAQEVGGKPGPISDQIAEDLMKKLQSLPKSSEKDFDINKLTFKESSKDGTTQSLDLLRNTIVSEEQIYRITPTPDRMYQKDSPEYQKDSGDSTSTHRIHVHRDLDLSLYPKTTLGIFQPDSKENQKTQSCLKTFDRLEERELNLLRSYAPRNWFEQCIQWTEQGKLWHFPINNEQGLEEQAAVSFTEHVFLEDHLEGWCPTFGPVRHFMELVCLGLSKNPYLSVEEKLDYLRWYKDYLEKHRDILEAAGTMNPGVTKVPALEAQ